MAKKNLLLCFDAFGTLFRPKLPISQQYGQVARQCGLSGLKDGQIEASFRAAFRVETKMHPNYGRRSSLGVNQWWENVIYATFKPLVMPSEVKLLSTLASQLLRRFSSKEGYTLEPHFFVLLDAIQQQSRSRNSDAGYDQIIVGVISNSDDRIMSVLTSFGVHVGPMRYLNAGQIERLDAAIDHGRCDVSFHCLSYDVGFEKPDLRIFRAAEFLLLETLKARGSAVVDLDLSHTDEITSTLWDKVYVGDDYDKDIVGALNAGWHPILFLGDDNVDDNMHAGAMKDLASCSATSVSSLFSKYKVVKISTLDILADRLINAEVT